jgi:hypothetical protein
MDKAFWRQITTFAAFFYLLVMAFDLIQGESLGAPLLVRQVVTTFVAIVIYGGILLVLKRRGRDE